MFKCTVSIITINVPRQFKMDQSDFKGDSLPIFKDDPIDFKRTRTRFGNSRHFYLLMNNSSLVYIISLIVNSKVRIRCTTHFIICEIFSTTPAATIYNAMLFTILRTSLNLFAFSHLVNIISLIVQSAKVFLTIFYYQCIYFLL